MGGPSDDAVRWVESTVGERVVETRGLREGGTPWLVTFDSGTTAVLRGDGASDTEVAALRLAVRRGIPVPRLLAVGDGRLLMSVADGTSRIPVEPTPRRLAALGAAAAVVHAVPLAPTADLPLRHRPIEQVDFIRWRARDGSTPLIRAAEDAVARLAEPACDQVFVHGDLWQGNTIWHDDELTAVIDWDCAGAGHPGVDIGSPRCDVAVMFGVATADAVLAGWQERAGRAADDVAYWDVVAALSTPPDLAGWESVIQDQGRPDLTAAILTDRRDEFLLAALDQLG
jgi:aminoglycoside phosphotransferase (APT) family kinase protein